MRKRATLFSGFLSHYLIHDRYGRPGKGNDKGAVEGLVGWARRTFMVPLPRFATWKDFNAWLEARCRKRQAEILRGHTETIGQLLARDLEAMADLPTAPFDACEQATGGQFPGAGALTGLRIIPVVSHGTLIKIKAGGAALLNSIDRHNS